MAPDASSEPQVVPALRIGFLGPEGTFTEEALLGEPDYGRAETIPFGSLVEVLDSVQDGQVDLGFVPLETSTSGSSGKSSSTSTST
jgi:prephenate dehydratase